MDPKNNLIKEPEKFKRHFAWFMKQFHSNKPILPDSWKFNHEVKDLKRFLFFYDIDFSQDKDLLRPEGYPIDIDRKFNSLVFRCRHVLEDVTYEVFEMTYGFSNFQDQRDLHEALELRFKDNLKRQYEKQLVIRNYRRGIIDKKMKKYQARLDVAKKKYLEDKRKKPLKRRNSLPGLDNTWKGFSKECDIDIRNAVVSQHFPYTLEFSPFEDPVKPEPILTPRKVKYEQEFIEPVKPHVIQYEYGYLNDLINKYQEDRGIPSDEPKKQISRKVSKHSSADSDRVFNLAEFQRAAEIKPVASPRIDVGLYQRGSIQPESEWILRWLEDPLGENQGKSFLPTYENFDIEMGEKKPLFENISVKQPIKEELKL